MERTKERWSSITDAQHLNKESNAGFGTLSCFPPKIRRKVYDLLLFDQCTEHLNHYTNASDHSSDPTEIHVSPYLEHGAGIFDFRVQNVYCVNNCCTSRSLRLQHTSSSLRNEYRDNLLASGCFKFYTPTKLRDFLRSLTPNQQLQIRHLSFIVSMPSYLAGPRANYEYSKYLNWRLVCSQLPTTLTSVVIEAMSSAVYWAGGRWKATPWSLASGQIIGSGANEKFKYVECGLLITDVICKEVKNRAPDARLSVRTSGFGDAYYSAIFNAVVAEHE